MNAIGVMGMTVSQVMGCGAEKGKTGRYRGVSTTMNLYRKVQVDIVVSTVDPGLVVAAAFTLLWLLIDDMRREIREVEEGYYREKLERKDKAALILAEIGTSLTVGFMWWLAIIIIIGVAIMIITGEDI